ncbi:M23 family metallopeptidase [Lentzea tibetensis]|uniref:M23 family metallopeptidase n=1 Tax=Lentzea tibetensis TaxID=2591470 RepID=A0A563EYZ3_9PSEU|nr:M23 family metallopeptidase [Lentzea tibetensis]TWP52940.1 M23 family metallopeptidase [Lentzea tibetensis]
MFTTKRLTIASLATAMLLGGPFVGQALAKPAFQLPFQCNTSWRLNTWGHAPALDMVKEPNQVGTEGAPVLASADGVVNQSFYHSNAGNMIQINHGGRWFTTQIHLQSRAVAVGARVKRGQLIGRVGKTGPGANNHPHLHFEQAYDANNDGRASWGAPGTERVKAVFNGVTYGGPEHRNVVSRNC